MNWVDKWTKSSLSQANGSCVEARPLADGCVSVRNSKFPRRQPLTFTAAEWEAFLGGVRLGEFDQPAKPPGA